jgi:hypothetical protein
MEIVERPKISTDFIGTLLAEQMENTESNKDQSNETFNDSFFMCVYCCSFGHF